MNAVLKKWLGVWTIAALTLAGCGEPVSQSPVDPLLITSEFDAVELDRGAENWIGVQDRSLDYFHRVLSLENVDKKQAELDPVSVDLTGGAGVLVISAGSNHLSSQNTQIARVRLSGLPTEQSTVDVKVGMVLSKQKFLYLFLLDAETDLPLKIAI